jgi:hypothetical protein
MKIVLAQVVPQMFDRIQFWTIGWLWYQSDICWNLERIPIMSPSPVNLHDNEIVGEFFGNMR